MRKPTFKLDNLFRKFRERYLVVLSGLVFTIGACIAAMACGWNLYTDHSVRFNSMRKGRGFYRLPPLPIMYDPKTRKEITVAEQWESYDPGDWEGPPSSADGKSEASDAWDRARGAVADGNLPQAQELLDKFLKLTEFSANEEDFARQERRNTAYDLLDAMTAARSGSSTASVKEYIDARYAYQGPAAPVAAETLHGSTDDANLADNWAYLRAANILNNRDAALNAFREHAARYPKSEKNEAVLYMTAKLTMQSSFSYENSKCGDTYEWGSGSDPKGFDADEECRDENWKKAIAEFNRVIGKYPRGRYYNDARGWIAYLYRRGGMRPEALAEYYRLLGDRSDLHARLAAKNSLQFLGQDYDDATLDKAERLIKDEPDAALAYAYHRIYNQAVDGTYDEVWPGYLNDYSESGQQERQQVAEADASGKHELERVASFASAMIKRYPNAKVSGAFVLRLAEAEMELQNYPQALRSAQRALDLGVRGEPRSEALWIKGSAEHQLKRLKPAEATFKQLVAEFPDSKLTEGARRLLAMTAEDRGDLETALKIYIDLKYDYDVAYFIDVLLPTDRLAGFVADNPGIAGRDYLLYSLGVRYLRDGRRDEARAALKRVATQPGTQPGNYDYDNQKPKAPDFPKEPGYGVNKDHHIDSEWVAQDIKTADALEHLEQAAGAAQGDEAKAEAMYQLASYQYGASSLLFYNPAAWEGERYYLLSDLANSDRFRLPNEWENLFEYSESHDTLARAIPLYLAIADKYPNTKAACDALYSAAVAHERLSDYNDYWRSIYERGLFAGPRLVDYKDVKRAFPSYQLPRGTNGWEPATRTVNGGPGWAPKPKPPVRPTRTQKIERMVKILWGSLAEKLQTGTNCLASAARSLVRGFLYALAVALLIWIPRRIRTR